MNLTFKYIPFLLSFFLLIGSINAQNKKIDSLKIQLENHKFNDTTRVNLLYDLSRANFGRDIGTTNRYLNEADSLSTILNYEIGKARIYYLKGMLENMKANYTESLHFFNKSLEFYQSVHDKKGIANVYTAFGITNYDLSKYDEAIKSYQNAAKIYKELNNKREIVTSLINIGNVYSETGNYKDAIANYKEALIISEVIKDEDGISYVYSNLGVVYSRQGNYPLAIENYNKSLEYKKKVNDTLSIAIGLNNIANVYTYLKKYEKVLEYSKQSLNYAINLDYKKLISSNNISIGNVYFSKKEYQKALDYFQKALKASQENNDLSQVSLCNNNLGNIYLKLIKPITARENYTKAKNISEKTNNKRILTFSILGIAETYLLEKDYLKAFFFTKKAKEVAEELEILEGQKTSLNLLSEIYQNTGQYKKALESYKEFKKLNDSLFNKENIERIAQLEYEHKYKQAIDSANIRELKLTKTVLTTSKDLEKSKRNYLWAIIGVLVISIASISFIFYEKLRNAKAIAQNVMIEQKLLRSQMTPHFIFNSLSVLQGIILNKEETKSVSYLSKFSKLLRLTLENSRDKMVSLSKELMAVENYLALQNLENKSYKYSINVENSIDTSALKIPPMLIQPFVENAVEHAFTDGTVKREIYVNVALINKQLTCTITDNGIGIDAPKEYKSDTKKSLSTTITSERLKILSKDFKIKGSVIVEDRKKYNEQGTIVTLIIPYKKENI